jgi:cysteinyl-tRNA synthetase
MSDLQIYNSLTRKKEKFEPFTPGFVGIYVCGPTVYGHSHLGHAKSYISFDIVVRYLRYLGYKVRYVQNITDVGHLLGDANEGEDRVLKQARLEQLEPMEVVETYTRSYFEDMDRLGLIRPDISPRASGHIVEQIEMVKDLLDKGFAYEVNGNVYFDVHKFDRYGRLSGRKIEELEAGSRVEVLDEKKHPADFALWKAADESHLMQWPSPWGNGYPGWHLECSVMSNKYLGETFDIHGGGLENVFPHHECEIAQSECAHDRPFARFWMHNNMVTRDGVKMGKSLNNFITIKDILQKYDPLVIRYFILMSHYRSTLDFSNAALDAAERGFKKLQTGYQRLENALGSAPEQVTGSELPVKEFQQAFETAMNDDFNTPQAIAAVFDFFNKVNKQLDQKENQPNRQQIQDALNVLHKTVANVLGLISDKTIKSDAAGEKLEYLMKLLLEVRSDLRKEKNFALTDKIRNALQEMGITVKDTPDGSTWKLE